MTPEGHVKNAVCHWLSLQRGVEFWVTNNVGIFDPKRRAYRTSKWSRPGVSDVWGFLPDNRPFWFEFKSAVGRLSEPQKDFQRIVTSRGHLFAVVRGLDDAEAAFRRWEATAKRVE